MKEQPNLSVTQTTRIAKLLLHSAQDRLWDSVNFVLGEDNTEVNDADITRIFNALKALL
jgi:hypothetical protein